MSGTDTRLEGALEYARRGWPVFPVGESKLPAVKAWESAATTDETQIREWFDSFIDGCNFGFPPGRAGIAVVDIDVQKKIKQPDGTFKTVDGMDSLEAFGAEHGQELPVTYTVHTPSGGCHWYYQAADLRSKNHFLDGVDVKSCGGYVLIPGSTSAKGAYIKYAGTLNEPAPMPQWFLEVYGHRKSDKVKPAISYNTRITPDTDDKIARAVAIIDNWPFVDEGERNTSLFQLMRELCKAGVSKPRAMELYTEYALEHIGLDPDSAEVAATVNSAYGNLGDLGEESEEGRNLNCQLFDDVEEDPETDAEPTEFGTDWTELEQRKVPERRWLIENWLSADDGYTVLFSGRGGTGKSMLALDLARCLATGEPWCGLPVLHGAKCMIVSCEDSEEDIARRVQQRRDFGGKVPPGTVRIVPRMGLDSVICEADSRGRLHETRFYRELMRQASAFFGLDGGVLILDTAADVFLGNENDRSQVSQFVKRFLGRLGRELHVTIIVLGHPPKNSAQSGQGFSGSTAWEGAFRCRWELNYQRAGRTDGLLELVLAKSNSTKAGEKILLENRGGRYLVADGAAADDGVKNELVRLIAEAYEAGNPFGRGRCSVRPIELVKIPDPITGEPLPEEELKEMLRELLAEGRIEGFRTNKCKGLRPTEAKA